MKIKYLFLSVLFFSMLCSIVAQSSAPTGLIASIENWNGVKYVYLNWDENSSGSVRYFVYKKEGDMNEPGDFLKLPMGMRHNSFKDKLVMPGQTYSYYITAFEQGTESLPSDTISINIVDDSAKTAFISGTLTDDATGLPLKNGKVELIPILGWHFKPIDVDSNGNYSAYVSPGNYFIHFNSAGYLGEFYDNAENLMQADKVELISNTSTIIDAALKSFSPPVLYSLSGKVTDESGNPLKALITIIVLNRNCFNKHMVHGVTDSLGNYSVPVREGDSVVVFAKSPKKDWLPEFYNDKHELSEADRIYINGDITGIDFVLDPKPVYNNSLSGKVTNTDGNSVMANVTLMKLRDHRHPRFKRTLITDSLGNYSFSNLTPGAYILLAIPEFGYLPTFFRYDSLQTMKWREADSILVDETSVIENINVTVLPVPDSGYGKISGNITDNTNIGINGAMVYLLNENQNIVAFGSTDINGNYYINNISPGSYTVVSDKFDYEGTEQTNVVVDYSANQTQTISLSMSPVSTTSVNEHNKVTNFKLSQNYPNPFNPATIISYQIPEAGLVTLKIYNVIGQEVAVLVNETKTIGSYQVKFDASKLNSGIYFYTLNYNNNSVTRKMTLIK